MLLAPAAHRVQQQYDRSSFAPPPVRAGAPDHLGLELLAADAVASPVVTAVKMPAGVEGKTLLKTLREKFNVVIGGGQQHLTNKIIRIGHLGYVQDLDLVATIAALEMALQVQGYAIKLGSGVSVAQEAILNKL